MGTCFATRAAVAWERLLARVGVGAAGEAGSRLAGPAGWRGGPQEGERGRPAAAPVGPSRPRAHERARREERRAGGLGQREGDSGLGGN